MLAIIKTSAMRALSLGSIGGSTQNPVFHFPQRVAQTGQLLDRRTQDAKKLSQLTSPQRTYSSANR
jgi:hypothetical protein